MAVYPDILGHERPMALLEKARANGRVAHAYLFSGPEGVGKERVAMAFAAALNCQDPEQQPCGHCESCGRIARGSHPDLRVVACEAERVSRGEREPEKGRSPSQQIRNADLDEVAAIFRNRPYMGKYKVVLIVDAERMNANSQNRFLKTLEEPSDDTVILLITAHPEALLATVRSRCQVLAFGPLPRAVIAKTLEERQGVDAQRALVLAAMSQGSLGRALQMAGDAFLAQRDAVIGSFERVQAGDMADLLEVAGDLSKGSQAKEDLNQSLGLMELWCRDKMLTGLGGESTLGLLINQDKAEELARPDQAVKPQTLLRWMEHIRRARSALRTNANPRLTMERCLLAMRTSRL